MSFFYRAGDARKERERNRKKPFRPPPPFLPGRVRSFSALPRPPLPLLAETLATAAGSENVSRLGLPPRHGALGRVQRAVLLEFFFFFLGGGGGVRF